MKLESASMTDHAVWVNPGAAADAYVCHQSPPGVGSAGSNAMTSGFTT